MNKSMALILASLTLLAACGQAQDRSNEAVPANVALPAADELVNDASATGTVDETAPVQRRPDTEISIPPVKSEPKRAVPKPKAEVPEGPKQIIDPPPPTDPHAYHDMNKM